MKDGLLLLHKPEGMTSFSAVSRVRRLCGADKAGHTGTLDPMATGVLPVLLGRAVKASEYLTEGDKHYLAVLKLGLTTDTEDVTGTPLSHSTDIPSEDRVMRAIRQFTGEQMQTPPMYSAIRVGGQRLMDLARKGETVERQARPIVVYSIDAICLSGDEYSLDILCSKGTYIRTLCADIGQALGCGGCMAALCRLEAAGYPLDACHTLEELAGMTMEEREACILPTESLFSSCPSVTLSPFFATLAHNGQHIYLRKIGKSYPVGTRVRLCDKDGFFALGEVRAYDDGDAVLPLKQFRLT